MARHTSEQLEVLSIRPLVRYVDGERAVIEIRITVHHNEAPLDDGQELTASGPLDLSIQMTASDGTVVEDFAVVDLSKTTNVIRFDMISPYLWWPAGMGEQALYELLLTFRAKNEVQSQWKSTIGLTSVRPGKPAVLSDMEDPSMLLVNGKTCSIQSIVVVDPQNEHKVLPATGDSLLLLRDHYGPDRLYDAADRAGILLVQSILTSEGDSSQQLTTQVDRLAAHPSLAGWLVTREGQADDRLVQQVRKLDPTRSVFRDRPGDVAEGLCGSVHQI